MSVPPTDDPPVNPDASVGPASETAWREERIRFRPVHMVRTWLFSAIGLVVAYSAAGLMRALVIGVSTRDPLTFGATAAVLGAIALLATYIPARRATRIDPLIALRTD